MAGPTKDQCSLLLFLATPGEEEALRTAAAKSGISFEKIKDVDLGEYHWLGPIGAETVIAIRPFREGGHLVMGGHGRRGSSSRAIQFREATGAESIVQIGMAFGVDPSLQRIGDVLVSTDLIPYDDRAVRPRDGAAPGWMSDYSMTRREPARPALVELFRGEFRRRARPSSIRFGAILSGAARIHCRVFRDELVRELTNGEAPIVGGEMEGVGLLAATRPGQDPIWCIVKGISDFADEDRDTVIKDGRPIACRNAAEFVLSALQNGVRDADLTEEVEEGP